MYAAINTLIAGMAARPLPFMGEELHWKIEDINISLKSIVQYLEIMMVVANTRDNQTGTPLIGLDIGGVYACTTGLHLTDSEELEKKTNIHNHFRLLISVLQ